ncbi:hypothetical protein I203_102332 [Kwoniella mangroviensis CBS 8507]|uniref:uncharacterized protein n=1 Tax=Kwoniella mangroviensis CBS 8507 TaxID=1296122 RepID=UPI00080D7CC8|nr:uncharacterized protein I203_06450 [Kwoniella mangroviensis CBS 8507]OCF64269.1 hypothetical protein I203_06450 [Kwoniella mangroviensis CBS 8507]
MSSSNTPNLHPSSSIPAPVIPKPIPFERIDTHSIKQQLHDVLGEDGLPYWKALNGYLLGQLARSELEGMVRGWFKGDKLELHNTLLLSLLNNASIPPTLYTPIPTTSSARKRKRVSYDDVEYDVDEEAIQPKSRVSQWLSGLNGRERLRIKRSVLGKNGTGGLEDGPGANEPTTGMGGRRMSTWVGQNTFLPPSTSNPTRHLPSSAQLSLQLAQYAKIHGLGLAPDSTAEIGEFLAVGLDSHIQDMLYGLIQLTGHDRPGISTIRLPKGKDHRNGDGDKESDNGVLSKMKREEPDEQDESPKVDLNSLNHLLMLNPTLNPTISPSIYKLKSGQISSTQNTSTSTLLKDDKTNSQTSSPVTSTSNRNRNNDNINGNKPRSEVITNRLLENSLLKLDNITTTAPGAGAGADQKKEKKHTSHWKYEDPAVLLKDFLG